eukprot:g8506.t1
MSCAYLKNYEIDKADRLCARIAPLCAERGGLWQFKLLNFYTTVRMKQSRYEENVGSFEDVSGIRDIDQVHARGGLGTLRHGLSEFRMDLHQPP